MNQVSNLIHFALQTVKASLVEELMVDIGEDIKEQEDDGVSELQ